MTTGLLLPLARQTSPLQEDDGLWPSSHLWLLRHDLLLDLLPDLTRLDNAALIAQILHVTDIIILFRYGQLIYIQAFAGI